MSYRAGIAFVLLAGSSTCGFGQSAEFSTVPTQAVYEFQLNYQLPWQRWYGGPGLSLGGTMPTQGAFGYSSLNGLPLPAPLGAGVYVNTPAPHGALMPGASPFGPAAGPMMMPPGGPVPMGPMGPPVGPMGPQMGQFQPTGFNAPQPVAAGVGQGVPQAAPPRMRQRPVPISAPAARRSSLEQQKLGDEKLRQQQWTQAYVHYRNAADLAPERAEAHFRLGLSYVAMKQYASAIRAFKRSLDLDPTLPQSGETLPMILGDDEKALKSQVIPTVADWAREDLRDVDRLFLLGLMLFFDEDPRGSEIFESALRTAGSNEYIQAFVNPASGDQTARRVEPRSTRSASSPEADASPLPDDLPPPPVPMAPATSPFPEPPPT